jgi:hypothetical protein
MKLEIFMDAHQQAALGLQQAFEAASGDLWGMACVQVSRCVCTCRPLAGGAGAAIGDGGAGGLVGAGGAIGGPRGGPGEGGGAERIARKSDMYKP